MRTRPKQRGSVKRSMRSRRQARVCGGSARRTRHTPSVAGAARARGAAHAGWTSSARPSSDRTARTCAAAHAGRCADRRDDARRVAGGDGRRFDTCDAAPGQRRGEVADDGLDLGELGHVQRGGIGPPDGVFAASRSAAVPRASRSFAPASSPRTRSIAAWARSTRAAAGASPRRRQTASARS